MEQAATVQTIRTHLADGPPIRATFVKLPGLEVIDCVRLAGLDLAVVDLEHSALDLCAVFDQLAYARASGLPCVVRVAEPDAPLIGRLLEAGACGIQLSGVRSRRQVSALVAASRFPPDGDRSVSTSHRGAAYGQTPVAGYVAGEAGLPLLVVQIESAQTDDPLGSILDAPVDVCFAGVVDLSVDAGAPGQLDHPAVEARIEEIADTASNAGVAFGQHVAPGGSAYPSARYLTMGTDVTALLAGLRLLGPDGRPGPA